MSPTFDHRTAWFVCPSGPSTIGLSLVTLLAGCGPSVQGPPLVPAEGLVTLDDKPLDGATIMLIPRGETAGQAGIGHSDASGRFVIATVGGEKPGVAVGSYRVAISKKINPDGTVFRPSPDQDPMLAAYKELLPASYWDEAQTTLTAEVPPGGAKNLEFKLKSKGR